MARTGGELDVDGAGSITTDQVDNGSSDACGIADFVGRWRTDCSHVGANTVLTIQTSATAKKHGDSNDYRGGQ